MKTTGRQCDAALSHRVGVRQVDVDPDEAGVLATLLLLAPLSFDPVSFDPEEALSPAGFASVAVDDVDFDSSFFPGFTDE